MKRPADPRRNRQEPDPRRSPRRSGSEAPHGEPTARKASGASKSKRTSQARPASGRESHPSEVLPPERKRPDRVSSVPERKQPSRATGSLAEKRGAGAGISAERRQDFRVVGASERFAERRRAARRAGLKRLGLLSGVVVVVAALAWLFLFSPVFSVRSGEIEVRGASDSVDQAGLNAVLEDAVGRPLLLMRTSSLEDDLRKVRGVRNADVKTVWPTGLKVSIDSRVPVAAIPDGKKFRLVDNEAADLGVVAQAPQGLPVVSVPLGAENIRTTRNLLEVLRTLPPEIGGTVNSIGAQTPDAVTFTTSSGKTVLWGDSGQGGYKAQVLAVLIARQPGATFYDVSAPDVPVTS